MEKQDKWRTCTERHAEKISQQRVQQLLYFMVLRWWDDEKNECESHWGIEEWHKYAFN